MSEILGAVRLKEKILIIVLMLVGALLIGGLAGAVTLATSTEHEHDYIYHMERAKDGAFNFVGKCQFKNCQDPVFSKPIEETDVTDRVRREPTCTKPGVKEYSFTYIGNNKTYTYTEEIPVVDHIYTCTFNTLNGLTNIRGKCIYSDCGDSKLSIVGASELKVESTVPANCVTPQRDTYSYVLNGEKGSFISQADEIATHKLNGKFITEYQNDDGTYKYGTEGIELVGEAVYGCGQKTSGKYVCDVCRETFVVNLRRPYHDYVLSDDGTTLPGLDAAGQAKFVCTAEGCTSTRKATLPAVEIGVNASVVSKDCGATKTQIVDYSHVCKFTLNNQKYEMTVALEIALPYTGHSYEYSGCELQPTFTTKGVVAFACKDCRYKKVIVIDEIKTGTDGNSEVVEATEQNPTKVHYKYTYTDSEYSFPVDIEFEIEGTQLSHDYKFELVCDDDLIFSVVGTCNQKGCKEPVLIRDGEENVQPQQHIILGDLIFTYKSEIDGETYVYVMTMLQPDDHNTEMIGSTLVAPTLSSAGSVTLRYIEAGVEAEESVTLPKIQLDGPNANSELIPNTNKVYYVYHCDRLNYDIKLTLTIQNGQA